jgi:hypothetical protein
LTHTNIQCYLLHASFLLGLFFDPEDGGRHVPPKYRLTFKGLHNVISHKIELFITTAVRTLKFYMFLMDFQRNERTVMHNLE